ncbi:MAG: hypothetical protein ACRDOK_22090 [Streptosporangiaceae bacterium]
MADGPRLLIAAALAKIIEPILRQSLIDATIRIADDRAAVEDALCERLRFDVVVVDLTWNDYAVEYAFDGLDVLDILRGSRRQTPVIMAAQGHGIELDHLDEAVEQPEVVGIYRKSTGPALMISGHRHCRPRRRANRAAVPPQFEPAGYPAHPCLLRQGPGSNGRSPGWGDRLRPGRQPRDARQHGARRL